MGKTNSFRNDTKIRERILLHKIYDCFLIDREIFEILWMKYEIIDQTTGVFP